MELKKIASLMLAALLVMVVMCGCAQQAAADPSAPAAAEGDASKIVSIVVSENPITLDPLDQMNIPGNIQVQMCMEPLVWYDSNGGYVPCLAKSWEYNEDGTEWTFHLQEGVTYHNGEAFDADDVACTFQRILDNQGSIFNPMTYWTSLKSYEIVDPYTIKIQLSEPRATMLMGCYYTPIMPNGAYEELGEKLWTEQHMYGTGPWVMDQWVDGQYCHYTKNEAYWDKANFDSYYDEVYVRYIMEASTAVASHLAGDVQAYIAPGGINNDMLSLYSGSEDRIELLKMDSGVFDYVGFSFKEGSPFQDLNVRKAFDAAIDRQAIVDNVIGSGKVPNGIIVDSCIGYNPDLTGYAYDPELAKQLLAESSYDGSPIQLTCNTSLLKGEQILLAMSEMLNAVGFNTSIAVVETATLADMRKTGDYDAFMVANMHGTNDPGQTLTVRILSDGHHSYYNNEELFELIRQSNREVDVAKRTEIIQQLAALMDQEHAPHSAICQMELTYAVDKGVTGLELYSDGWFNLKHVTHE